MTVLRDLMSTRVALTAPEVPVAEAAAVMVKANVGSAVVMQGRFLAGSSPNGTCCAPPRPVRTCGCPGCRTG